MLRRVPRWDARARRAAERRSGSGAARWRRCAVMFGASSSGVGCGGVGGGVGWSWCCLCAAGLRCGPRPAFVSDFANIRSFAMKAVLVRFIHPTLSQQQKLQSEGSERLLHQASTSIASPPRRGPRSLLRRSRRWPARIVPRLARSRSPVSPSCAAAQTAAPSAPGGARAGQITAEGGAAAARAARRHAAAPCAPGAWRRPCAAARALSTEGQAARPAAEQRRAGSAAGGDGEPRLPASWPPDAPHTFAPDRPAPAYHQPLLPPPGADRPLQGRQAPPEAAGAHQLQAHADRGAARRAQGGP
jgi:hypothetical protein